MPGVSSSRACRCGKSPRAPSATWRRRWWNRRSKDGISDSLDFLFIENVGNLVCPSSYDLGEHVRIVLLSVTEGEDKPLKYPTIFNTSDLAVITKIDLAAAVDFDREEAYRNIHEVRPGLEILEVSARTGAGMDAWRNRLTEFSRVESFRRPLERAQ